MELDQLSAVVFDTFGTVVDWRSSLIEHFEAFGAERGVKADWAHLADRWRGEYGHSIQQVRSGEVPWMTLDELHRASIERLVAEARIDSVTSDDLDCFTSFWHRLRPWSDSVPGLSRLRRRFIIGPLSNGNVALLVDMARFAGLPWDFIPGSDIFRHYKPDPEVYLGACRLLGLEPSRVMMAAAHAGDLAAAQRLGMATAYFPRPTEHGRARHRDDDEGDWDVVASDIGDLAARLGA